MLRSASKQQELHHDELPIDIVEIILSRLPVKSLLKFRCVSKPWISVISSSQFLKSHLRLSKICPRIMLLAGAGEFLDHYSLSHLLSTDRIDPRLRSGHLSSDAICAKDAEIIGSLDGLICILLPGKELILWNPSIRRHKSLPGCDIPSSHWVGKFGFGFDDSSNDYKVLCIFEKPSSVIDSIAKVFSFTTGQWKSIEYDFPTWFIRWYESRTDDQYEIQNNQQVLTYGNGKFYWVRRYLEAPSGGGAYNVYVCYLEVKTKKYRMFEFPGKKNSEFEYSLALSEQNLVHVLDSGRTYTDVWTMKEDDVCWTKLCTIDYAKFDRRINAWNMRFYYMYVLNNGEILLLQNTTFRICNPKDGSVRCCEITSPVALEACTYVESLVWQ